MAGWISCVCPPEGFDPGPIAAEMIEPAKERLAAVTAGAGSVRAHVAAIVRGGFFPEALAERDEAARQSIEREAQVTPGEVASLPDYGMGLADLVMAPRTTTTIDTATTRVTRRLRANPRVTRVREVGVRRIDTADGKPGLAIEIRAEVGTRDARIAFTLPGATR